MARLLKAKKATQLALLTEAFEALEEEQDHDEKRREWAKDWLQKREDPNIWSLLYTEVEESDHQKFRNVFRMVPELFNEILAKVRPVIEKQDTQLRQAIPAKLRLMVAIRYLTGGGNFQHLEDIFRISRVTISKIVPEVCDALWEAFNNELIRCPKSPEEWLMVAKEFDEKWQYPRGLGAIDGKHVQIQAPGNSGSLFRNYKGTFSLVLLAVSDADYKFLYVDVGTEGASNDAGIFERSSFKEALMGGALQLPKVPEEDELQVPYHFLCDDAFGLSEVIMKPYPHKSSEAKQKVFNYRFSRGRRVVENAFGLMAARCYVLRGPILQSYPNAIKTVKACVMLHNFMLSRSTPQSVQAAVDEEGLNSGLTSIGSTGAVVRGTHHARLLRDRLADHFMTTGQVSFQWQNAFGTSKK